MMQTSISYNGGPMQMVAVGRDGRLRSLAQALKSQCGCDFDEYVRRALSEPFPHSSQNPATRTITTLWFGRRFQLYSSKDTFRKAKVTSWKQYNSGPFCPYTFWDLKCEMLDFVTDDVIVLDGLQAASQHNGKKGKVMKFLTSQGRYKVKIKDGGTDLVLAVKPQNIKATKTVTQTFTVRRMNVNGGGTLFKEERSNNLLSLEWLDPAIPEIDLDEGALKANCPICRSVESPLAAYDAAKETKDDNCPVCLEDKKCRILQCNHFVCHECWQQWRNDSFKLPIEAPTFDPVELKAIRDANDQEFVRLVTSKSGPGAFNERAKEITEHLIALAEREDDNLCLFWKEVMKVSAGYAFCELYFRPLTNELPIPALEILLRVWEEQMDELAAVIDTLKNFGNGKGAPHHKNIFYQLSMLYTNRIGELYEEVGNFRGAIPWYERSVVFAKRRKPYSPDDEYANNAIGRQYSNLALAQKRAGLLSKALDNYNIAVPLDRDCNSQVTPNRHKLLVEINEWTGSSGKLTPGC